MRMMRVGDLIKKLRKEHRLTQADLAKKLNVAPTAVSAWERHENRPLIDKIVLMSELFNVPMDRFFESMVGEGTSPRPGGDQGPDLVQGVLNILNKHNLDLNDPATLELLDSALDFVKRVRKE